MKVSLRQLALAMAGAGMLTIHGCGGGSGDTAPPPTSEVASLPAYLLTQPASSNCAALRSGTYNQILPVPDGPGFPDKISKFVIDAAAGTWNVGASSTALIASGESCHYTMTGGTEFVVSPAGVMVIRFGRSLTKYLGIALPEQAFKLADMAGTWNSLGMDSKDPLVNEGVASTIAIDSAGNISSHTLCRNPATWDVTACAATTVGPTSIKENSDGGFDAIDPLTGDVTRIFAYKAGNGDVMGVRISALGLFDVSTMRRTNNLPTVGTVTSHWNLQMNALLTSPDAINAFTSTIKTVGTGSWTRVQKTVGGDDDHEETLKANTPRDGYTFRAAGTALATNGTTVEFSEFTSLNLRGMGVSPLIYPASKRFAFSVNQP